MHACKQIHIAIAYKIIIIVCSKYAYLHLKLASYCVAIEPKAVNPFNEIAEVT